MPEVGSATVMPFFEVIIVLRLLARIRCILHLPNIILHGARLVKHQNDIRGDILGNRARDLRTGGICLQRDGIGAVVIGFRRLVVPHAAVSGGIIRIGGRSRDEQREEKGQA